MSDSDNGEFDEKLMELNNWQIEQENKLKLFQEVQKRLLDLEHEKIIASLEAQFNDQMQTIKESDSKPSATMGMNKSEKQTETSTQNQVFNYESGALKLKDPKISLCSLPEIKMSEKLDDFVYDNEDCEEESETIQPRRFLKRGTGLARFNMTFDDFKTPPNIYREKKIKTYLSEKPDFNKKKTQRKVKGSCDGMKRKTIPACKSKSVPVNIFLPENNKSKNVPTKKASESKVTKMPCTKNKELSVAKTPIRTLTLKPVMPFNYTKKNCDEAKTDGSGDTSIDKSIIEKEIRKDEKELQMFELLEGKIGDGSLSPNSSLVAKFMEQSACSTPFKPVEDGGSSSSNYTEKCLSLDNPNESEEEIDVEDSRKENAQGDYKEYRRDLGIIDENQISKILEREFNDLKLFSKSDDDDDDEEEEEEERIPEESKKSDQMVEDDFVKIAQSKKKDEDHCQIDEDSSDKTSNEENLVDINEQVFSQREIAIKLQRKALQDNVKTLLNWDGARKKKIKKQQQQQPIKKPKEVKSIKRKIEDEEKDLDKMMINNELINQRMAEIEKELEIFQRENKALIQTKKEFEMEKVKLEKERKEFEKYMEREKEKFDNQMKEERAKLQKERNVFEKHTKQLKNQPNKKEREEIANLKKEIRQLNLTMTTKEGRFKALRVSLSSQIKKYALENMELKSELEKLKKLNMTKSIMSRQGKNCNTKIINAINNELGKLRPHLMTEKICKSQTARVDGNGRESVRRVNSDPNLNNKSEKDSDEMMKEEKSQSSKKSEDAAEESARALPGKTEIEEKYGATWPSGPTLEEISNSMKSPPVIQNDYSDCDLDGDSDFGSPKLLLDSKLRENYFEMGNFEERTGWIGKVSQIKKRLENLGLIKNLPEKLSTKSDEESHGESDAESSDRFRKLQSGEDNLRRQFICTPDCQLCRDEIVHKRIHEDGVREIKYPNGNVKLISADKRFVKMMYYNGDSKLTDRANGKVKYHYAHTDTWHTTFRSGMEILEFPNRQVEKLFPNGATKIIFPNGCIRYCDPSGKENWTFPDGTAVRTDENGDKVLILRNGLKEVHTDEYKRREYPNGTVKIVYVDGLQETIYASGRIVWKDVDGTVLRDTAKM